jgi:hypothetical protein
MQKINLAFENSGTTGYRNSNIAGKKDDFFAQRRSGMEEESNRLNRASKGSGLFGGNYKRASKAKRVRGVRGGSRRSRNDDNLVKKNVLDTALYPLLVKDKGTKKIVRLRNIIQDQTKKLRHNAVELNGHTLYFPFKPYDI